MAAKMTGDLKGSAPPMAWPVAESGLLHIIVVILAIAGLPHLTKDRPMTETSMTVELVEIAEVTQGENKPAPVEKAVKPADKPKPKTPDGPTTSAKNMAAPPPSAPVPPDIPDDVVMPQDQDVQAEVKPTPAPKPLPKPKPKNPPPKVEKKKPEEVKKSDADELQNTAFKSLLRNLGQTTPAEAAPPDQSTQQQPFLTMSSRMTMSELDALRAQLGRCWKVLAGARFAENQVVEVKIIVNRDGSVNKAIIVDQSRYNQDRFFRAAAESARRAVLSCSPLNVPPDKYDQWREINIRFDPREMLQ